MEFEVAADAEPDQLVGVELRRDNALVEAEQLAVKRAGLVAAAGGIAIETRSAAGTPSSTTPTSSRASESCRSNIVAPYLLTALVHLPQRLIYGPSGAFRAGDVCR
jgi:hypothetical protein